MPSNEDSSGKPGIDHALKSIYSDLSTLTALIEPRPQEVLDEEPTNELIIWRESALISLQRLKDVTITHHDSFTVSERAKIVFAASTFAGQDSFTDDSCRSLADECLRSFVPLDRAISSHVLLEHLKPIFQSAMHTGVRQDTGRVKHNPLGLDIMYDEQPWKSYGVGSWNVLAWVLLHIESDSIESLWPLIIPPLLTIVDDYDPPYKIRGIMVTSVLLQRAPASLLRRTGIDELLFKALQIALQNLTSYHSPNLLRAAMPCYLELINLVLLDDSATRFNKLCEMVTDSIVPGWLYASSKVELMIASAEVLLPVIQALGIGAARFLRVFIPQLTENLLPKEFSPVEPVLALRIASAKCLLALMKNTRPRVPHWRHRILDSILRCWVDVCDRPESSNDNLKETLLELFTELLASSSGLLTKELSDLEDLDAHMFSDFLDLRLKCA